MPCPCDKNGNLRNLNNGSDDNGVRIYEAGCDTCLKKMPVVVVIGRKRNPLTEEEFDSLHEPDSNGY